ncbi:PQQ-binding-like beta-propeller repeat protein, partial [Akkermansiaceae bacterium]|nr:PQQ-binding-like beta-propeller repeat protein [Akkermansiaceae bacterium]
MKIPIVFCIAGILSAAAADWPRWMGGKADGVWRETGIRADLPEAGAPVAWRVPVGWGYSGPAVADGRVYVSDYQRSKG